MARLGNGTTAKVLALAPAAVPSAYTWHFWYRNDVAAPSGANIKQPFTCGQASSNARFGFSWNHTSAASQQALLHRDAAGAYQVAKLTTPLTTGIWYPIGATWDGTTVRMFLRGIVEAQVGVSGIHATAATFGVNANAFPGASFDQGAVSDFAYWDVCLAPAEMVMLAKYASPLAMRRQSLRLYWPLLGSQSSMELDKSGNGKDGLVTAATVVAGPFGVPTAEPTKRWFLRALGSISPYGPIVRQPPRRSRATSW